MSTNFCQFVQNAWMSMNRPLNLVNTPYEESLKLPTACQEKKIKYETTNVP